MSLSSHRSSRSVPSPGRRSRLRAVHLRPRPAPRGNAVVLAAGLLALLVILATAFIVRTQSNRQTAAAVAGAIQRDDVVGIASEVLVQTVADALFVRPINLQLANDTGLNIRSSNLRRLPAADPGNLLLPSDRGRYGIDSRFPFNFAPYHVVPFTNWPDELPGVALNMFPRGPGAPAGATGLGESNPFGNPGQGDTRWLRCFEPVRWDIGRQDPLVPFQPGPVQSFGSDHDTFRFWRHLTNLSRDDNGLRIVADITDVMNHLVLDLNIPVEQWLVSIPPADFNYNPATGFPRLATQLIPNPIDADGFVAPFVIDEFMGRWFDWMGTLDSYGSVYRFPLLIPQNLYDLAALSGGGARNLPGSRPEDEYIAGTARHTVSRVLTDTDGSGITDALWHLLPGSSPDGTIHLLAASIVDNAAMLDMNVATRFRPGIDVSFNINTPTPAQLDAVLDSLFIRPTVGETPADLALIGENANVAVGQIPAAAANNWNVGFLDVLRGREVFMDYTTAQYAGSEKNNPYGGSSLEIAFNRLRWQSFLGEIGHGDVPYPPVNIPMMSSRERRLYWIVSGRHREVPDPIGYTLLDDPSRVFVPTPFGTPEEIELRAFHGHNYHWNYSRLERALNATMPTEFGPPEFAFLRADVEFAEASPYTRLNLNELLHDKRRTITVTSGTRNDLLPGWLRWRWRTTSLTPDPAIPPDFILPRRIFQLAQNPPAGLSREDIVDRFFAQTARKVDLREPTRLRLVREGELTLQERLPQMLLNVFSDGTEQGGESYYGSYASPADDTVRRLRRLAAGYAANILTYRTQGNYAPLDGDPSTPVVEPGPFGGAIPLPEWGELDVDPTERYLGMKKQPFLMEAFVGHLYEMYQIPSGEPHNFTDGGERVVLSEDENGVSRGTTVTVVQIANPHREVINLADAADPDFRPIELKLFNNSVISISQIVRALGLRELQPATERNPVTMILFSIEGAFSGDALFRQKVRAFLDILPENHPAGTIFVDLQTLPPGVAIPWSVSRGAYDNLPESQHSIELIRVYTDPATGADIRVVIDRAESKPDESRTFASQVREMLEPPPHPGFPDPPVPGLAFSTLVPDANLWAIGTQAFDRTHFMQWRRFTRAWGSNFSGNRTRVASGTTEFYRSDERAPRYVISNFKVSGPSDAARAGDINDPDPVVLPQVPFMVSNLGSYGYFPFPADPRIEKKVWPDPFIGASQFRASGHLFNLAHQPNDAQDFAVSETPPPPGVQYPWFTVKYHEDVYQDFFGEQQYAVWHRKPTFFDMNRVNDPAFPDWSYPDKGYYGQRPVGPNVFVRDLAFPMQMLQKNQDFQQVGELLNVWLFGHRLEFVSSVGDPTDPVGFPGGYVRTLRTFSEHMGGRQLWDDAEEGDLVTVPTGAGTVPPMNDRVRRNRVERRLNRTIGGGDFLTPQAMPLAAPPMPAMSRLIEAFVCDGPGYNFRPDAPFNHIYENFVYSNAQEFSGRATPGLVNINTAPVEVLRSLPHWYKVVHATASATPVPLIFNPRTAIPEAIVSYRERYENNPSPGVGPAFGRRGIGFAGPPSTGGSILAGPNWLNRPSGVRGERGFASIGEVMLLDRMPPGGQEMQLGFALPLNSTVNRDHIVRPEAWRIDFAGLDPFELSAPSMSSPQTPFGAFISTDVTDLFIDSSDVSPLTTRFDPLVVGDGTAGDVEERNLLFAGASNLITTRSDVFTVTFRIRSVRRNPRTGLYNALDPEFITHDARYVMQVDRSQVNQPGDRPRILFLERMPF